MRLFTHRWLTCAVGAIGLPIMLIGITGTVLGQTPGVQERGAPLFIEQYAPEDYSGYPQNWAVTQDDDGIVYVGNKHGILEFDGISWQLWPSTNHTTARSLAFGPGNRIYGGFQGDLGYLDKQPIGTPRFVSLVDSLPESDRQFDDVWATHSAGEYVYFQTRDRIFQWDGSRFRVFRSESTFRTSFSVRGTFYTRDRDRGLLYATGDSLVPAQNGDFFIDRQIYMMAPFTGGRILIGTRESGLFIYDGKKVTAFPTEVDDWLLTHRLYSGATVQERMIVLGTLGGGIAVVDDSGRLHQILDEDSGLVDGWINYVFVDNDDAVWLAHHNRGVARLDVPSELTQFDERHSLKSGIIYYVTRVGETLFLSTSSGLYHAYMHGRGATEFSPYRPEWSGNVYSTIQVGRHLVVATDRGIDILDQDGMLVSAAEMGPVLSLATTSDPHVLYAGTSTGIRRLVVRGGEVSVADVPGTRDDIRWITVDRRGHLWAMTLTREVLHLIPRDDIGHDFEVYRFGTERGVPAANFILSSHDDQTVIVYRNGILRFESGETPAEGRFVRDEKFDRFTTGGQGDIKSFVQDQHDRVWIVREGRVDILTENAAGMLVSDSPPVLSIPKWNNVQIFVEDSGAAWLTNDHRLYLYDPPNGLRKSYAASLPPLIRQVTLVETGERVSTLALASASAGGLQELDYRQNAIRFDFALPSYNDPEGNLYQFFLEGHDQGWSEFSSTSHKNYTNLLEGTYRFRVRGRNAQGSVSPEAIYTFRVLPPWYRTIWAYAIYLALLVVLGVFILHYRRMAIAHRKATEQAEELERERMVNERLQESYRRLQEANESLLQADKLKDEFLASTSHELRTPLTAILGFASILKEEVSGEHREFLGMIEENGKRLLHTLNSLLDLAKLRVGMMDLHMQPTDLTRRAHEVGKLLMPLATKKGLELDVRTPSSAIYAMLDPHSTERVLYNLVGNAIKFTDEGSVSVVVSEEEDEVRIIVSDTGIGIDDQFLPHLFDEFKQESSGNTREHEGTGLGLAITNRLIQIMHGSIAVSSEKGKGSVFVVTFPRYHTVHTFASDIDPELVGDAEQVHH